jgi:ATP-binding cassette subfamily F protein uup
VRQRPAALTEEKAGSKAAVREKARVKLSYKEMRALESLPGEIEALEAEQRALAAKMGAPEYFRQPSDLLRAERKRNAEIEALLMEKLERWEALEAKAKSGAS